MSKLAFVIAGLLCCVGGCAPVEESAVEADVDDGAAMEAAVAKVKDLIVKHDEQSLRDVFTAGFVENVPVAEQIRVFDDVHADAGRCTAHRLREALKPRKIAFRFECEKRATNVTIGVERDAPHRINYLLILPAT